jgi:ABC-type methionine transport system permease subunit
MAGTVGGGGLGIRYGYRRFMPEVMLTVVVILVIIVQVVAVRRRARRLCRQPSHRAPSVR